MDDDGSFAVDHELLEAERALQEVDRGVSVAVEQAGYTVARADTS